MCSVVLKNCPCSLMYVPRYLVIRELVKTWQDDYDHCNDDDDDLVEWYNGCKNARHGKKI